MSTLMEKLLNVTYYTCYECGSIHNMKYIYDGNDGSYMCEECYREIPANSVSYGDMDYFISWRELKVLISTHPTPRKVIKMFITKILREEYEEPEIDELLHELRTSGTFMGH